MNIVKEINNIITKNVKYSTEIEKEKRECSELNKKANILAVGQIQKRSIKANVFSESQQVNRPLEQQRARNLIEELGIKYIDNLSANFSYPCLDGTTSRWCSENEQVVESDTEFKSLRLEPKRLCTYIEYSKDVILNSSSEVAQAIESDLIESIFEQVQSAMFNEIYDESSAMSISDYADICNLEFQASEQKISNSVYLLSPTAAKEIKQMTNGDSPIFNNGQINGNKAIETPLLDGNKIIFADFTKLLLAQWGCGLDVTTDPVTKAKDGVIRVTSNTYWAWGAIDENAFVYAKIGE